jgi:hypothetical protein
MDSIQNIEQLREYVQQTLCERHALEPTQFPMVESILTRAGQPCGLYFCQHGPRLTKAHAVWAGERSVVAFYDDSGNRFHKVQLRHGPDPRRLAA